MVPLTRKTSQSSPSPVFLDEFAAADRGQHRDEPVRVGHEGADLIGGPTDVGVHLDRLCHRRYLIIGTTVLLASRDKPTCMTLVT